MKSSATQFYRIYNSNNFEHAAICTIVPYRSGAYFHDIDDLQAESVERQPLDSVIASLNFGVSQCLVLVFVVSAYCQLAIYTLLGVLIKKLNHNLPKKQNYKEKYYEKE